MSVSSIRSESPLVFQAAPNADSEEWVAAWKDVLAKGALPFRRPFLPFLALPTSRLRVPHSGPARLRWADAKRLGRCHRLAAGGGGRGDECGGCVRGQSIAQANLCTLCSMLRLVDVVLQLLLSKDIECLAVKVPANRSPKLSPFYGLFDVRSHLR